ncbi:hypothetical protein ACTXT7_008319 [Hymenolepis weldensis]
MKTTFMKYCEPAFLDIRKVLNTKTCIETKMAKQGIGRQPNDQPVGIPPQSVSYFHGKITRDQAETTLFAHKALEGLFLLRESVNQNYAISICHGGRVHHYNIEKQPDGTYQIRTGMANRHGNFMRATLLPKMSIGTRFPEWASEFLYTYSGIFESLFPLINSIYPPANMIPDFDGRNKVPRCLFNCYSPSISSMIIPGLLSMFRLIYCEWLFRSLDIEPVTSCFADEHGRKFPGPVELVKHHSTQLDGFLTLARFPLDRPPGESPIVLQGVRAAELEEKLRLKAMEMGLKYLGMKPRHWYIAEWSSLIKGHLEAFVRHHGVPLARHN